MLKKRPRLRFQGICKKTKLFVFYFQAAWANILENIHEYENDRIPLQWNVRSRQIEPTLFNTSLALCTAVYGDPKYQYKLKFLTKLTKQVTAVLKNL